MPVMPVLPAAAEFIQEENMDSNLARQLPAYLKLCIFSSAWI